MTEKAEVDFIGIGFSKCGTTWVAACLRAHPEICFSAIKETMFFSRKYEKGLAWYREQFSHCDHYKIKGEYTPDYVNYPEALERIKQHAPHTKFIVTVRNQHERLRSMWRYQYIRGIHMYDKFEEYLENTTDRAWERGLYHGKLQPYAKTFGVEHLHLITQKDIEERPHQVATQLYSFLGVDPSFVSPTLDGRMNTSEQRGIRSLRANRLLSKGRIYMRNTFLGRKLIPFFEATGLKALVMQVEKLNRTEKPRTYKLDASLSPEMQARIVTYYKNDTAALAQLFGMDTSTTDELLA